MKTMLPRRRVGDQIRFASGWLGLASATALLLAGCGTPLVDSIQITPAAPSISGGQTVQFTAVGTYGHGSGHPSTAKDVTDLVTWASSSPAVASISPTGMATAVSPGTTSITAKMNGFTGVISATATVTVTGGTSGGGSGPASGSLLSLTVIPSSITVGNLQDTGQFLAIGTFSTPPTIRDLTNSVTWISSFPSVFPVNSNGTGVPNLGAPAGVVTAYGSGNATITAEATDVATGSIQTATATFACPLVMPSATSAGTCYPGSQAPALLATVTVYNEGLNTSGWLVTAPSATGTPNVIHCGPGSAGANLGSSVCVATYPIGTTLTLTAPAESGVQFGGWSSSCTSIAPDPSTAAGPNTCTFKISNTNTNISVGAIFN